MAWWLVERWEALRLAWGARGALPREVGTLIPPQGVPIGALAPPTAPSPRAGRARDWQTSDALRRENTKVWLFEILTRSPDGAQRNPGQHFNIRGAPDCAALHPGYEGAPH